MAFSMAQLTMGRVTVPAGLAPVPTAGYLPTIALKPSSFLMLPAEIRNIIYRLLLTCSYLSQLRRFCVSNYYSDYHLPGPIFSPSLLGTCKQIRAEAQSILYGENTFSAHPSMLTSWPFLINSFRPIKQMSVVGQIRRWYIFVRLDVDPNFTREKATAAFEGAEELEIEAYQAQYGSSDYSVLMLFQDVRGVKNARVKGSVKPDFARWLESTMMAGHGDYVEPYDDLLFHGANGQGYELWTHGGR